MFLLEHPSFNFSQALSCHFRKEAELPMLRTLGTSSPILRTLETSSPTLRMPGTSSPTQDAGDISPDSEDAGTSPLILTTLGTSFPSRTTCSDPPHCPGRGHRAGLGEYRAWECQCCQATQPRHCQVGKADRQRVMARAGPGWRSVSPQDIIPSPLFPTSLY